MNPNPKTQGKIICNKSFNKFFNIKIIVSNVRYPFTFEINNFVTWYNFGAHILFRAIFNVCTTLGVQNI